MKTKIIFSEECLEYGRWHIESPRRIRAAARILKNAGCDFLVPKLAPERALRSVHSAEYLERLKKGDVRDAETPAYDNIYRYARLSAGGAILASRILGLSLMRPPGHHAGKNGLALGAKTKGFCYLNNVAVAVKLLKKPALILDLDAHHGNGTEEVFFGDKKVTYVSLHRWPEYPGTGEKCRGNCLNFPLPAECGESVYLRALDRALKMIDFKGVGVVAVSLGLDAHRGDMASLGLTQKSFGRMGEKIAKLKKPTFFVLEGGYAGRRAGNDIKEMLEGFEAAS